MTKGIKLSDPQLESRYLGELLHASQAELSVHFAQPSRLSAVDFTSVSGGRLLGVIHELVRVGDEVSWLTVRRKLELERASAVVEVLDELIAKYEPQGDSLGVMSERIGLLARARRVRDHHLRGAEAAGELLLEAAEEHAREALGEQDRAQVKLLTLHGSAMSAVHSARKAESGAIVRHIPFGFPLIDVALKGGLRPATMAIIGGRTGCGKSSLMLASALLQANAGLRVGIVSCEDSAELWGERAIGHFAHQPVEDLLGKQLAFGAGSELDRVLARLAQIGVQLTFPLNRPLPDVLAAVRALIADGCKVIYLDYVQAILLGREADLKVLVRDATQRIKAECQQHGVALVVASQLKRAEPRDRFREPYDNDLKETGDLENMTEALVLLWKTSDGEDARELGKVSKVKWSGKRPRFELQRDDVTGVVRNLLHMEREGNGRSNQPTRATWE